MARIRRNPEEAAQLILDAAEEELLEVGFEAFKTSGVARRAGVSRPLVVHYFGSRDEMLQATVGRALEGLAADVMERLQELRGDTESEEMLLPSALMQTLHPSLRRHARLILMAMVSGRRDLLSAEALSGVIGAIHATRVVDKGEVPYHDTLFVVTMQVYSLLLDAVSENLIGELDPSLGDASAAGDHFRAWLAKLAEAHIKGLATKGQGGSEAEH